MASIDHLRQEFLISDEEQRLNRRQRCTLSQLRSGDCHLLQDYKHKVFSEPSDICRDCGASPQDVRYLFACYTHPTGLSPEDLWQIRWDQFVRLATSTTVTLTDLTTDLPVANNNTEFSPLSSFVIRCRFGDLIFHCRQPGGGILLA